MSLASRAARTDDIDAVAAVLDAASRLWQGRATPRGGAVQRLSFPGTTPEQDTVLVEDEHHAVVAFGHIWPEGDELKAYCRVHPDHRGRGASAMVLRILLARAQERHDATSYDASIQLSLTTPATDTDAEQLVAAHGFRPARHWVLMVTDLRDDRPAAPLPDNVTVRTFRDGDDDAALLEAFRSAFAEHWGAEAVDDRTWWWDMRDAPDAGFDSDLWLLATDDQDRIAGFCLSKVMDGEDGSVGYVSSLGTVPAMRGRGLGYALLVRGLDALAGHGLSEAQLNVDTDNVTDALHVYRKAGMVDRPAFTIWTLDLT